MSGGDFKRQIERVKEKLESTRREGWEKYTYNFAVESHRFLMNPTLDEETVGRFETQHRIELPSDYRAFLTEVGNGGAGPGYGILPLERWHETSDYLLDEIPSHYLSKPFLAGPQLPREQGWVRTLDCPYEERYRGAIAICHQGCTYFIVLVVDGKHRGCLCYIDLDDQGPPAFIRDGFLTFYENWLDRTLSGRR